MHRNQSVTLKHKHPLASSMKRLLFASLVLLLTCNAWSAELTNVTCYATTPNGADPFVVAQHDVFELTLVQPVAYSIQDAFNRVAIQVVFSAPSGEQWTINGFYYQILPGNQSLWKARMAAVETGTWSFRWQFGFTDSSDIATGAGAFEVVPGSQHGFLGINPVNHFRWQYADGTPVNLHGFNDCFDATSLLSTDGGERTGAWGAGCTMDEYFRIYSEAGFNLFRFSQDNCSAILTDTALRLTSLNLDFAATFDVGMQLMKKYNFSIFYGLMGYRLSSTPPTGISVPTADTLRYLQYSIDRWAAYVDIWEIQNEVHASAAWDTAIANYIKSHDPYRHPVTTSWNDQPGLAALDLNAPHGYDHTDPLNVDQLVANTHAAAKTYGKPVIYGEMGNSNESQWNTNSAANMRIRAWTGFFKELHYAYWNSSFSTGKASWNNGAANLYLGPEERQYGRVLQWFASTVITSDLVMANWSNIDTTLMHGYGLRSSRGAMAYFNHWRNHTSAVSNKTCWVTIPVDGTGYWIDPKTGQLLASLPVWSGPMTLEIPTFIEDIAFFSIPDGAHFKPVAILTVINPQDDGDLDNDGQPDFAPRNMPFGEAPLTLTLDASASSDLDGGALSYLWNFGDGSPAETANTVIHTYTQKGHYLLNLTVTDDEGNASNVSGYVRATADSRPNTNDPPVYHPMPASITVREGNLAIFSPLASDFELNGSAYTVTDPLFTMTDLPSGASFGSRGAVWIKNFFWVPAPGQNGTYTLSYTASDPPSRSSAAAPTRDLVINVQEAPVSSSMGMAATQYDLAFSTYLGGTRFDSVRDVVVDNSGNIIVVGGTSSSDFPTTAGAYNRTYNAGYTSGTPGSIGSFGPMDVFVAKFDPSGQLLWSTYLGGRNYDRAYGVEVDAQGDIYAAGRAGEGFPVTAGAFKTGFSDYSGGNLGAYGKQNGFVAKFSSDGQLLWASYVGWELCRDIAVDAQGDTYLPSGWNGVGPALPPAWFTNGFQKTPKGGGADVCVLKIKSDGSQVLWGTWLCGTGNDKSASSIRVDAARNVYWAGYTSSTDMPTAGNGRSTYLGGPNDFYLAKLSPDGSNLIYGCYLGGLGDDEFDTHQLAVDALGNAYCAVWTLSTDCAVTPKAFQPRHGSPTKADMYICKVGSDGTLLAGSYLGGIQLENIEGVSVDGAGNVYVTGTTHSPNFPTAGDPY